MTETGGRIPEEPKRDANGRLRSRFKQSRDELDEHLERFERRLPSNLAAFVRWLRKPG